MPIVLLRVDERLIHGQVVVGWGERIHMESIAVVDDALAQSDWEQDLYRVGLPAGMEAEFQPVETARQRFQQWKQDRRNRVVLLRDVTALENLALDGLLRGEEVNLGGIHAAPHRSRVLPYLYLSGPEKKSLQAVAATGAVISARDLPGSRAILLADLLDGD